MNPRLMQEATDLASMAESVRRQAFDEPDDMLREELTDDYELIFNDAREAILDAANADPE